jgi:glycosyltransferase involved in cell wall biosynthesis
MVAHRSPFSTTVLIAGIDTIRRKNLYQLQGLGDYGYRFIVIAVDPDGDSRDIVDGLENVEIFTFPNRWSRPLMAFRLLKVLISKEIKVAEIYPFSYGQLILALIVKLARIPIVLIARGEEYNYLSKQMLLMRRLPFWLTYWLGDYVIYKAPYMETMLQISKGKKSGWMLPNAVKLPDRANTHRSDKCHFLFLNSLAPTRYPEIALNAFLELCQQMKLTSRSNIRMNIVGFLGDKAPGAVADKEDRIRIKIANKDVPIELHQWTTEPNIWFDDADVFLLPADVVFPNYSLLEAMSLGVPPIVQESNGSELIVTDGVDGYILPPEKYKWKECMLRLIEDVDLRKKMGEAARLKVTDMYSIDGYLKKYDKIYSSVLGRI